MTLEDKLRLSFYRPVGTLDEHKRIMLVQHTENRKIYVMKTLDIYDASVYMTLKDLDIKGIPEIYEAVEDNGSLTVIEEYISGDSLKDRLSRSGTLSEKEALGIFRQLLDILSRLHSLEPPVIHRDIKPSNVILCTDGSIRLIDFNAAKFADMSKDRDTVLIGTHGYAAPEQYSFAPSGVQTDIYAAGKLLRTMTAGKNGGVYDRKLEEIINKCTALDPKDRYKNTEAVIKALNRSDEKRTDWLRFMPPGLRNDSPVLWIFSIILYALLFDLCLTLDLPYPASGIVLYANRIIFLLMFLTLIFFFGNYLNVFDVLKISKIRNIVLRIFAILFIGAVILVLFMLILKYIELNF